MFVFVYKFKKITSRTILFKTILEVEYHYLRDELLGREEEEELLLLGRALPLLGDGLLLRIELLGEEERCAGCE